MSPKEAIEKIKELFAAPMPAAPVPPAIPAAPVAEKMAQDYPTKDGSMVLTIDNLAVGGSVLIAGQPAPDGEYILQDGTKVQVSGGLIAELSSATEDAIPEEMKNLPAKMAAIEERFTAHEAAFNQVKEDFAAAQGTIQKQDEAIKMLLSVVEKLADAPKTEPVAEPKTFRVIEKKESRIDSFAKQLQTIKN